MARVYTMAIIATGIMFLLFIGGIDTNSSQILSAIGSDTLSLWSNSSLWLAVAIAIAAFLATNRVVAGGFSFQASRESVMAGFAGAVYVFFASDMFSIVNKVGETTCPIGGALRDCGWEYWIIWSMIVPLMVGFAIALIQFIGGQD